MRILLALDGSHGAETARALCAALPWPDPTQIDVVRAVEPGFDMFLMPAVAYDASTDDVLGTAETRRWLDAQVADLASPTRTVTTHVVVGRPATTIVELAERLSSECIVVGSRGRGPIGSMVLGSVSAEVVDHAPCPVLVARTSACRRMLLALDGTPLTDRLVETLAGLPMLRDVPVDVVCVSPSVTPGPGVMLSGAYGMPVTWYEESVDVARQSLEPVAAMAAERLRAAGLQATWSVHAGDPAGTLLDVAQTTDTDLIVVGTHGRTGMTRLLLGSVARNVLLHAHASVLVLRDPGDRGRRQEPTEAVGAAG